MATRVRASDAGTNKKRDGGAGNRKRGEGGGRDASGVTSSPEEVKALRAQKLDALGAPSPFRPPATPPGQIAS